MQTDVATLQALVAQETTLEGSLITLLQGLFNQIQTGIDAQDLAAIQATNTQLGQNINAITAAIQANTPAAPAAPAQPDQPSTTADGSTEA